MSTAARIPQRTFLAVTVLTVIALATVFMVYAALLASYTGGDVTISSMGGQVQYSLTKNPGSWAFGPLSQAETAEWYAKVHLTSPPTQTATVKWTLQHQESGSWSNTPTNVTAFTSPSISLTISTTDIYAFSSGGNTIDNNYNWGQNTAIAGVYRVIAEINTA